MARVGFQPTIPVFERAKIFRALDGAATVVKLFLLLTLLITLLWHDPRPCAFRGRKGYDANFFSAEAKVKLSLVWIKRQAMSGWVDEGGRIIFPLVLNFTTRRRCAPAALLPGTPPPAAFG
jgi:hypothetical protein